MSDKLFDNDATTALLRQWKAETNPRKKECLLGDLWKQTEPLAEHRIDRKVFYFTEDFDRDDYLSLLRQRFLYAITKFDPDRGKLFTLLWRAFDNEIRGKLKGLCEKEDQDGVRNYFYENELDDFNDPDERDCTAFEKFEENRTGFEDLEGRRIGFERLEMKLVRAHGGAHGWGREKTSAIEELD
jgi:hypothetical protein